SLLYAYLRLIYDYIIFFFSSRRRHTRFSRDWSSDVCSSDLHRQGGGTAPDPGADLPPAPHVPLGGTAERRRGAGGPRQLRRTDRSEEHTSELQSRENLVCRLRLEKKKKETAKSIRGIKK